MGLPSNDASQFDLESWLRPPRPPARVRLAPDLPQLQPLPSENVPQVSPQPASQPPPEPSPGSQARRIPPRTDTAPSPSVKIPWQEGYVDAPCDPEGIYFLRQALTRSRRLAARFTAPNLPPACWNEASKADQELVGLQLDRDPLGAPKCINDYYIDSGKKSVKDFQKCIDDHVRHATHIRQDDRSDLQRQRQQLQDESFRSLRHSGWHRAPPQLHATSVKDLAATGYSNPHEEAPRAAAAALSDKPIVHTQPTDGPLVAVAEASFQPLLAVSACVGYPATVDGPVDGLKGRRELPQDHRGPVPDASACRRALYHSFLIDVPDQICCYAGEYKVAVS